MRVLSTKFRPNRLRNVEGAGKHSLMPLSKEELSLKRLSRKFKPAKQRFVQHFGTKFHENLTSSLVIYTGSQADGWPDVVAT